jgi:hypothetical protein
MQAASFRGVSDEVSFDVRHKPYYICVITVMQYFYCSRSHVIWYVSFNRLN